MKFRWALALGVAAYLALLSPLHAAESKAGGVEFSGNIDVVTGWQHDDSSVLDPTGSCAYGVGGLGCNAIEGIGSGGGQLGDFRGLGTPNRDTFNFYLDQVELDLNKSFAENIRIRADLDFGRFLSGTGRNTGPNSNFILEQAYITFNIAMGNGIEILVGRFNAPIGLESVDRADNVALSFSNLYRFVRPHNLTGAKLYYPFSDLVDWNFYLVNNLEDVISLAGNTDSAIPSYGTRVGFTWGDEGRESTLGISYAGGPEQFGTDTLSHLVDLDFMLHITKLFSLGGEGMFRLDTLSPAIQALGFTQSSLAYGGFLLFNFTPGDTWNFYFRYGYLNDAEATAAYTGMNQQIHDFTAGAGYQITEGAKVKLEYRLDLHLYAANQPLAALVIPGFNGIVTTQTSLSHGLAAEFAYNF